MNITQLKNQHLCWRAGFGPSADQMKEISRQKPEKLFHSILKASERKPDLFDVTDPQMKALASQPMTLGKLRGLKPEEKKIIRKQSVQDIAALNIRWLDEMTNSNAPVSYTHLTLPTKRIV